MITVNESARDEVLKLLSADEHPEGSFVRVGVKGGGCSGLLYEMTFDHDMKEGDEVFENNGVKVVVLVLGRHRTAVQRRPQWKGFSVLQSQCQSNMWLRREFFIVRRYIH